MADQDADQIEMDFCAHLMLRWAQGMMTFTDIDNELYGRYKAAGSEQRAALRKAMVNYVRNAERFGQNLSSFSSIDAFEQSRA